MVSLMASLKLDSRLLAYLSMVRSTCLLSCYSDARLLSLKWRMSASDGSTTPIWCCTSKNYHAALECHPWKWCGRLSDVASERLGQCGSELSSFTQAYLVNPATVSVLFPSDHVCRNFSFTDTYNLFFLAGNRGAEERR